MVVSLSIAAGTCLGMVLCVLFFPQCRIGKITIDTYWPVVLIGAVLEIAFGQISPGTIWENLTSSSSVNPLKILVLFLSMTMLSIFLDEVGFFRYLAAKAVMLGKRSQPRLFFVLFGAVSFLTVFTSNDIIILTFTPFICYFCKHANIDPKPYLVSEFVAANTMSMMLIIGNPTNIYIASANGILFLDYLKTMALPTLTASAITLCLLWLLFRKTLSKPMDVGNEEATIEHPALVRLGVIVLLFCTVFLAIGPYIHIEMWIVALASALFLFVTGLITSAIRRHKPLILLHTLKRAPWPLVPFLISMFVIVLAISNHGFTDALGHWIGEESVVFKYGLLSFLFANLMNNIPMSVLFCPVLSVIGNASAAAASATTGAIYATIVGSNLGAYLTPMGALAGIMWMSMLKKQDVKFGYVDFLKYGSIVSIPALLGCLAVLFLVLPG